MNFFAKIWQLIASTPLMELTALQLLIVAAICVVVFFLLKWFFEGLVLCIKKIFKIDFSAKARCKKITCKYCGRNLAECTCQKNKNLSYRKRLKLCRKEQKEAASKKKAETKKKATTTLTFSTRRNNIKK